MHEVLETDYALFWIEDSILFCSYKAIVVKGYDMAKRIVADRLSFQNERPYPILCDVRRIVDSDKIARDFLAREGSTFAKAISFLVQPLKSQAQAEFFIQNNKPLVPTGIFTNQTKAIAFLMPYK